MSSLYRVKCITEALDDPMIVNLLEVRRNACMRGINWSLVDTSWLPVLCMLAAVRTSRFRASPTAACSSISERHAAPSARHLEMRTKLLVGSALLLWLFGIARPRYFYPRPFGWGHF